MGKSKKDIMAGVVDVIATNAEKTGKLFWSDGRIWEATTSPMNWAKKTLYKGVNRFTLGCATRQTGEFATYNQVASAPMFRVPTPPMEWVRNHKAKTEATTARWKMPYHVTKAATGTTPSSKQQYIDLPTENTGFKWNGYWKHPYVKRGAKSLPVIFWKPILKTEKEIRDEAREKKVPEEKVGKVKYYLLKEFRVFEIGVDTVGVEPRRKPKTEIKHVPRIEEVEDFVEKFASATALKVSQTFGTPCYKPLCHEVQIPPAEHYKTIGRFYETELHEFVHSTMGACGRKGAVFGSKVYSQEEVVAEIGCMSLLSWFGIAKTEEDLENASAYVLSWARKLRENPQWLFDGAKAAEKAVSYMFEKAGIKTDETDETDTDNNTATTTTTTTSSQSDAESDTAA